MRNAQKNLEFANKIFPGNVQRRTGTGRRQYLAQTISEVLQEGNKGRRVGNGAGGNSCTATN